MGRLIIPGRPVPYTRMTQKGKWVRKDAGRYLNYKNHVTACAMEQGIRLGDITRLKVTVYLFGKTTPFGRDGDVDNYLKAAMDALNGIAYKDDRQIIEATGYKRRVDTKDEERMVIEFE